MFLTDIITSEVRAKLLIELFSANENQLYVRELTRNVGTEINAIRRELKRMTEAGIIRKEQRGNRLYYLVKNDYALYDELLSMVNKEVGIGKILLKNKNTLGKIKLALLSKKFAEGKKSDQNELELLLVGEVDLQLLNEIIKKTIETTKKDINYTVLTEADFFYHKKRKEYFLMMFLMSPYITVIGDSKFLTYN